MKEKPNIIFIISDHHRFDYMGCAGNQVIQTPNLDRLASEGTSITGMYCNAPICVPSRITITTGRYPSSTGCYTNSHPADFSSPTFIQALADAGYSTGMIGKFHHHTGGGNDFGIINENDIKQLGYQHVVHTSGKAGISFRNECRYTEHLRRHDALSVLSKWYGINSYLQGSFDGSMKRPADTWPLPDQLKIDNFIAEESNSFIKRQQNSSHPFFLHVGFCGPHPPLDASKRFHDLYRDTVLPEQVGDNPRNEGYWRGMAATISETDEKVGMVLDTLDKTGQRDNTIIIYTSDHGDMMGDHGRSGKCIFYEGSVHIPFIIAGPGITPGKKLNVLAELLDSGKTICDFAGIDSHPLDQGKSLKNVLLDQCASHRSDVFTEMGSEKMIYDGTFKLMYGNTVKDPVCSKLSLVEGVGFRRPVNIPSSSISLFDIENDPYEEHDLADNPEYRNKLWEMKEKLLRRMVANSQSVPVCDGFPEN